MRSTPGRGDALLRAASPARVARCWGAQRAWHDWWASHRGCACECCGLSGCPVSSCLARWLRLGIWGANWGAAMRGAASDRGSARRAVGAARVACAVVSVTLAWSWAPLYLGWGQRAAHGARADSLQPLPHHAPVTLLCACSARMPCSRARPLAGCKIFCATSAAAAHTPLCARGYQVIFGSP